MQLKKQIPVPLAILLAIYDLNKSTAGLGLDTEYVSLCHANGTGKMPTLQHYFSYGKEASAMDSVTNFDWDNEIQGHLLSAYPIGYIFGNIMGGPLCNHFGAKRYMGVSMILAGILQLASPVAASQGPWFLYSLRLVFGASVSTTQDF